MIGIALALRALGCAARILACEVETATPLREALASGGPVTVERRPSFVDGMGSTRILDEMWPLLRRYVDEMIVVSLSEVESAVRALARECHIVAEGAGAAAVASALSPRFAGCKVAAIVSGGNIDPGQLCRILQAEPA